MLSTGPTSLATHSLRGPFSVRVSCFSALALRCRGSLCAFENGSESIQQIRGKVDGGYFANPVHGDVSGGEAGNEFGIEGIVALARKNRGDALAPDFLHCGKNANLVIDEHIVVSRIASFNIFKFLLFVNVNQDFAFHGFPDS